MDTKKKKALESKGYKVGTVEEFLGLSPEESEYIELKLALSEALIKCRKKKQVNTNTASQNAEIQSVQGC